MSCMQRAANTVLTPLQKLVSTRLYRLTGKKDLQQHIGTILKWKVNRQQHNKFQNLSTSTLEEIQFLPPESLCITSQPNIKVHSFRRIMRMFHLTSVAMMDISSSSTMTQLSNHGETVLRLKNRT